MHQRWFGHVSREKVAPLPLMLGCLAFLSITRLKGIKKNASVSGKVSCATLRNHCARQSLSPIGLTSQLQLYCRRLTLATIVCVPPLSKNPWYSVEHRNVYIPSNVISILKLRIHGLWVRMSMLKLWITIEFANRYPRQKISTLDSWTMGAPLRST